MSTDGDDSDMESFGIDCTTILKALRTEEAWTSLTDTQRSKLYNMLGESGTTINTTVHPLRHPFYGEELKGVIAWMEELIESNEDVIYPEGLKEAKVASTERAAGVYDASMAEEAEEFWGQKTTSPQT